MRVAKFPRDVRIGWLGAVTDGEIETFRGQRYQSVRHLQLHPNLGIVRQESGYFRHQLLPRERDRRRHAHKPAWHARQLADLRETGGDLRILPARAVDELLA